MAKALSKPKKKLFDLDDPEYAKAYIKVIQQEHFEALDELEQLQTGIAKLKIFLERVKETLSDETISGGASCIKIAGWIDDLEV